MLPDKDVNIAAKDEWKRMFSVREVEKGILVANKLGAKIIVVHPGDKKKESEIDACIKSLNEIYDFSREWDINLVLENTFPGDLGSGVDTLKYITSQIDLPMCFDTSHSYSSGNASDIIEYFRDKIMHLHISDNYLTGEDDHLLPGEGKIDWQNFWKQMKGFQGNVIFELMPDEDIKKRIFEIKEVMKKWEKEYFSSR